MSIKRDSLAFLYVPPSASVASEPLGNTAGKVSTQKNQGVEDGRKKRFELREVEQKSNPKGFERLGRCGKNPLPQREVELYHDKSSSRAYYTGVETCGNPWACPVCSAKIKMGRGLEIGLAVDKGRGEGYKVTMLTFTHPHYKNQSLAKLIDMHNRAVKRFRQGRFFQRWKKDVGFIGSISSAEVTHGQNGWHWHTHVIYITRSDDWDDYALSVRWLDCLRAVGFEVNSDSGVMEHGLDVMRDCHATDYLVKMGMSTWGADKEMTASHRKEAGRGGLTPFQLLEQGEVSLWQEYVIATKGRKQLVWSKGLKKWAKIEEKTDEEVAATEEIAERVAVVPRLVWWQLVRQGLRLELLEILEDEGIEGLKEWCVRKGIDLHFPRPKPPAPWADFGGTEVYEVIA